MRFAWELELPIATVHVVMKVGPFDSGTCAAPAATHPMPFTPYHFGPGIAMKAAGPAGFSFTIFCCSQFVIDLEPGYLLWTQQAPVHRFFHTFVGATLVGLFCALTGKPLCEFALRVWQRPWFAPLNKLFGDAITISWRSALASALLGTYSHVILDAMVHGDPAPFSPLNQDNPFYGFLSRRSIEILCIECGVIGLLLLLSVRRPPSVETAAEPQEIADAAK
jgi:hypothetical protein